MPERSLQPSDTLVWPPPPRSPADELAQVLAEHGLLDAGCSALIEALRRRGAEGQPVYVDAQALAQRLAVLQREHQAQLDVQLSELRVLYERSATRLQALQRRVNQDAVRLETCCTQLDNLRAVHARLAQSLLAGLHVQTLHAEMRRMQEECGSPWQRPATMGRAFAALSQRLQDRLAQAQRCCEEIHGVMVSGYAEINSAYKLKLSAEPPPLLQPFADELSLLSGSFGRQLGLGNLLRLVQPEFRTRLERQLQARLVRLFHAASAELERWSHALWTPAQTRLEQARERLQHRHDTVQRVQSAVEELQQRIGELEAQDLLEQESFGHAQRVLARLASASSPPSTASSSGGDVVVPLRARAA